MHTPDLDRLAARLRGALIRPGDSAYESARRVHNGAVDRRPAFIARCAGAAEIAACVDFARESGLQLAIRGGGHHGAGLGACDGGVVIDLSRMRRVQVNPHTRMARVEGGATWGDVDRAAHEFGLATPGATVSTAGVGGVTTGGGIGHLTRSLGLSIDNLIAAEIVLADGRVVTASAESNSDLFWAIRGGGGNFGVVSSFIFRLHALPGVVAAQTIWPIERAGGVLRFYRDFIAEAPRELGGIFSMFMAPPRPPIPERLHNRAVCGVTWCYTGPPEFFNGVFGPVRRVAKPVFEIAGAMPFPVLQSLSDGLHRRGARQYWTGALLTGLPEEVMAVFEEHGARVPSPLSSVTLFPMGGAASDAGAGDTAFVHRNVRWAAAIVAADTIPGSDRRMADWTGAFEAALEAHSAGVYVNFLGTGGPAGVAAYGENYSRLCALKLRFDPCNLFSVNHNIRPAPARTAWTAAH